MPNDTPKPRGFGRKWAAVAVLVYTVSLILPALRPGSSPEVWSGFRCLVMLVFTFPFGILLNPSGWANVTFAIGCASLHRGHHNAAAAFGVISLLLAGSLWVSILVNDGSASPLLSGYWVWLASMGVLTVASLVGAALRRTRRPKPVNQANRAG